MDFDELLDEYFEVGRMEGESCSSYPEKRDELRLKLRQFYFAMQTLKQCATMLGNEDDEKLNYKVPREIRRLQVQLRAWQAAHTDMVKRCALLRERHDLPVDRIPAYEELIRLQKDAARYRYLRTQQDFSDMSIDEMQGKPWVVFLNPHLQTSSTHVYGATLDALIDAKL